MKFKIGDTIVAKDIKFIDRGHIIDIDTNSNYYKIRWDDIFENELIHSFAFIDGRYKHCLKQIRERNLNKLLR